MKSLCLKIILLRKRKEICLIILIFLIKHKWWILFLYKKILTILFGIDKKKISNSIGFKNDNYFSINFISYLVSFLINKACLISLIVGTNCYFSFN